MKACFIFPIVKSSYIKPNEQVGAVSETLCCDHTLMQLIISKYLIACCTPVYINMLVKVVLLSNIPEVIVHCRTVVMVIS